MTNLRSSLQTGLQQSLVMTPKLQQAIKLLQLSSVEVAAEIAPYLLENPLLEMDDGLLEGPKAPDSDAPHDLDISDQDFWDPSSDLSCIDLPRADADHDLLLERGEEESLRSYISRHIGLLFSHPADIMIALRLLDGLDASGYLVDNVAEIAQQLGTQIEEVESVLQVLQTLEPAGLFARTLAECLSLQLRDRNRLDPQMETLIDHLEDLGGQHYDKLMSWCQVTRDELKAMVTEIKSLNPRPGTRFLSERAETMIPDVLVKKDAAGLWQVHLNPVAFPKITFQQSVYEDLKDRLHRKEDKAYLTQSRSNADWLLRALQQRAESIFKVASEIVRQQEAFFNHGIVYLKPMVLRDVAEKTGLHESTISRVTTQKFMVTPRGTFEMKYFFGQGIANAIGTTYSAKYIKERIAHHIRQETPQTVLSDDALVESLKQEGIDAARRTVAKYREAMNIPSSAQRRRGLKAAL
jgi:RNA polymerase sigma-54 factor